MNSTSEKLAQALAPFARLKLNSDGLAAGLSQEQISAAVMALAEHTEVEATLQAVDASEPREIPLDPVHDALLWLRRAITTSELKWDDDDRRLAAEVLAQAMALRLTPIFALTTEHLDALIEHVTRTQALLSKVDDPALLNRDTATFRRALVLAALAAEAQVPTTQSIVAHLKGPRGPLHDLFDEMIKRGVESALSARTFTEEERLYLGQAVEKLTDFAELQHQRGNNSDAEGCRASAFAIEQLLRQSKPGVIPL